MNTLSFCRVSAFGAEMDVPPKKMRNMLDRYFNGIFHDVFRLSPNFEENESGVTMTLPLPGFNKEQLSVSFENGVLTVDCDKPDEKNPYQYSFSRRYSIPEKYDGEAVTAEMINGLLRITVPRKKKAGAKRKLVPVN